LAGLGLGFYVGFLFGATFAVDERLVVSALFADHGNDTIHGYRFAFFNARKEQGTFLVGFQLHGSFVGFYFGQNIAGGYLIAHFFLPRYQYTLFHRIAHFWHPNDRCIYLFLRRSSFGRGLLFAGFGLFGSV
jgi:hypothetical protein